MNDIALIIVTAFLNILITGVVSNLIFYRYQKKIEDSFSKSLYAYQTKFSRSYPKFLDVLEGFIYKYDRFSFSYRGLVTSIRHITIMDRFIENSGIVRVSDARSEIKESNLKRKQIDEALKESQSYFREVRIYLPDDSVMLIDEVLEKSQYLIYALGDYFYKKKDERFLDYVRNEIEQREMDYPSKEAIEEIAVPEEDFIIQYMILLDAEATKLWDQLEKHYKASSEINRK